MKIRITQTLTRTVEQEVQESTVQSAVESALLLAKDIQPADWEYTWEPVKTEAYVLPN